jgi:protease-4
MFFKSKKRRLEQSLENDAEVDSWERGLVSEVVTASLAEMRRSRRWGIFFKSMTLLYLFVLLWLLSPLDMTEKVTSASEHTALVEVNGVIAAGTKASADKIVEGLRDAFDDENTKAVILRINSPGGSPVQSGYVYDEIRRLRTKHKDIPIYAVITDIGASGAYYMASAADAIYADKASIVGSIGVLMNGFGFVETLKELGIERRLLTAGDNKGMLDPFSPMSEKHESFVRALLERVHGQFITAVKQGRKDKLVNQDEIFSGLFWSGEEAVELGLVDALGSSGYVAREIIGVEEVVDFTPKEDWMKRFTERLGASMAGVLTETLGMHTAPLLR